MPDPELNMLERIIANWDSFLIMFGTAGVGTWAAGRLIKGIRDNKRAQKEYQRREQEKRDRYERTKDLLSPLLEAKKGRRKYRSSENETYSCPESYIPYDLHLSPEEAMKLFKAREKDSDKIKYVPAWAEEGWRGDIGNTFLLSRELVIRGALEDYQFVSGSLNLTAKMYSKEIKISIDDRFRLNHSYKGSVASINPDWQQRHRIEACTLVEASAYTSYYLIHDQPEASVESAIQILDGLTDKQLFEHVLAMNREDNPFHSLALFNADGERVFEFNTKNVYTTFALYTPQEE